jgi:hypothetical protein
MNDLINKIKYLRHEVKHHHIITYDEPFNPSNPNARIATPEEQNLITEAQRKCNQIDNLLETIESLAQDEIGIQYKFFSAGR